MLYLLSKIVKTITAPANLLCLLLLIAGIACVLPGAGVQKFGRRLCFALAIITLMVAVLPAGHWMLQKLEDRFPPEAPARVDGIILLAGGEDPPLTAARGDPALHESAPRYVKFAALAREYPNARLAFIGGNSSPNLEGTLTNADVARMALNGLGVPERRMTYENVSHNTYENAIFGAEVVKPKPDENWLLVTSAAHMTRSMLTFRKAGWNVFPAPTDYNTSGGRLNLIGFSLIGHLNAMNTVFYEYGGLITYWAMGRIDWPWAL